METLTTTPTEVLDYGDTHVASAARAAASALYLATPQPQPWTRQELKQKFLSGEYPELVRAELARRQARAAAADLADNVCLRLVRREEGHSYWHEYALEPRHQGVPVAEYVRLGNTSASLAELLPRARARLARLRQVHGDVPLTYSLTCQNMPLGLALQGRPIPERARSRMAAHLVAGLKSRNTLED